MYKYITGILLMASVCSYAHSGKARFHVMIDTDGAADDLRAICMLLGNREVEVLAITTSEGALTPAAGALKVSALLRLFRHEGIPVAAGRSTGIQAPLWRNQSERLKWGDTTDIRLNRISAGDLIRNELENEEEKVTMICMGALTNLNDALTARPQLKERIESVIWYCSSALPLKANHSDELLLKGANYEADRMSARQLLAQDIPVRIISGNDKYTFPIDGNYLEMLSGIEGRYVRRIIETHTSPALHEVVQSGHMKAWDDLIPVYLFTPELFSRTAFKKNITIHSLKEEQSLEKVRQTTIDILVGKPDSESRVFYGFPEDDKCYAADIVPVMKDIIARHGRSEWRAGVLANELHGHLGIYAVVGVKMGIRVREYFNIGVDDMTVESFAGLHPPISCLNDGLQVSTGATLGHGLISVAFDSNIRPEATFTFKNKTIRMRLKQSYMQQIRRDVEEGIRLHGNLTEAYWQYIRSLAIRYWLELDRNEIFEKVN